jgi:hypothetical protein
MRATRSAPGGNKFTWKAGTTLRAPTLPGHPAQLIWRCARAALPAPFSCAGAAAFKEFQDQMRFLLNKIRQDGRPAEDDSDIGAQVGCSTG